MSEFRSRMGDSLEETILLHTTAGLETHGGDVSRILERLEEIVREELWNKIWARTRPPFPWEGIPPGEAFRRLVTEGYPHGMHSDSDHILRLVELRHKRERPGPFYDAKMAEKMEILRADVYRLLVGDREPEGHLLLWRDARGLEEELYALLSGMGADDSARVLAGLLKAVHRWGEEHISPLSGVVVAEIRETLARLTSEEADHGGG